MCLLGKYVDSLPSFSHLIPVEEKMTGKGGDKNLSFVIFRYDDWNGEQQAVSVHLTVCKIYTVTHGHDWLSILPTL